MSNQIGGWGLGWHFILDWGLIDIQHYAEHTELIVLEIIECNFETKYKMVVVGFQKK